MEMGQNPKKKIGLNTGPDGQNRFGPNSLPFPRSLYLLMRLVILTLVLGSKTLNSRKTLLSFNHLN